MVENKLIGVSKVFLILWKISSALCMLLIGYGGEDPQYAAHRSHWSEPAVEAEQDELEAASRQVQRIYHAEGRDPVLDNRDGFLSRLSQIWFAPEPCNSNERQNISKCVLLDSQL